MPGGNALAPFDRHPADAGALTQSADRLAKQASRAIDANRVTLLAFLPATHNWDGIAAPELRTAPRPVRQRAYEISDSLAWSAAALRYWAAQVTAFNSRVDQITRDLLVAKTQIFSATDTAGEPMPLSGMLEAAQAVDAVAKRDWHEAYQTYIADGGQAASRMLDDGPTPANVAVARHVGLIPPGGLWNPIHQMWKAFKGNVVPPGDWGPLGHWPWAVGRGAAAGGAGLTLFRHLRERKWAAEKPWRIPGTGPYAAPSPGSLIDRAAKAFKGIGTAAGVLDSVTKRKQAGASTAEAVAGAAAENTTTTGCATAGARAGAAAPIPHPVGKGLAAAGGGLVGGAVCSPVGKAVGDGAENTLEQITDGFKSLVRPPWR